MFFGTNLLAALTACLFVCASGSYAQTADVGGDAVSPASGVRIAKATKPKPTKPSKPKSAAADAFPAAGGALFSSDGAGPKYMAEVNPLGLVFGATNFEASMKLTPNIAAGVGFSYFGIGQDYSAYGVEAFGDYYVERMFKGLFGRAAFGIGQGSVLDLSYMYFGFSVLGGYRFLFKDRYTVGLGAGLQYFSVSFDADGDAPSVGIGGVGLALMANVGIVF